MLCKLLTVWQSTLVQSVFSALSQGLEDEISESSIGQWADTAATYCQGKPSQSVLKSMTKHRDRVEIMLCVVVYGFDVVRQS